MPLDWIEVFTHVGVDAAGGGDGKSWPINPHGGADDDGSLATVPSED